MNDEHAAKLQRTRAPEFWQERYALGEAGWDLGSPSPTLIHAIALGLLDPGAVLVPGCGRGHDALLLAESGFDVTAVDFAETAVEHVREEAKRRDLSITARQADIFDLFAEPAESFDAVFEYTCYCAIDPSLRTRYAELITHLVRPGGRLLMLAFPLGKRDPGPPHEVRIDELEQEFGDAWRKLLDVAPRSTPPPRAGRERLLLFERV